MNTPDRSATVRTFYASHPEHFTAERHDENRRKSLPALIAHLEAVNPGDRGKWGVLVKHDRNDKVPCDVIVWKDTLQSVDIMDATGGMWGPHNGTIRRRWRLALGTGLGRRSNRRRACAAGAAVRRSAARTDSRTGTDATRDDRSRAGVSEARRPERRGRGASRAGPATARSPGTAGRHAGDRVPALRRLRQPGPARPPIDRVEAEVGLTRIIFSFAFLLASVGFGVAPASQRSTCCKVTACFVAGCRTSTSRRVAGPIRSSQGSWRKV